MGLKKAIESPALLHELFLEYVKKTKSNPRRRMDFKGSDVQTVHYELEVPLTMVGFENYCFEKGVISDLSHYFSNKDGRYEDFVAICSRIKAMIRQDQIEGGMVGLYNPSITQRLNSLVDKSQSETTVKAEQPLFPDVKKD